MKLVLCEGPADLEVIRELRKHRAVAAVAIPALSLSDAGPSGARRLTARSKIVRVCRSAAL